MNSIFALLLFVAEPLPYACGPFLLQPGVQQMTVVIDHHAAVAAELVYGIENEAGEVRIVHEAAKRHHVFALKGLRAGTRYWYEVRTGVTLSSGKRSFRTLPAEPKTYRVIVLGDVRSLPQRWHKVSEQIFQQEKAALFIIGTGDYPSDGRNYGLWRKQFFEPARNLLAAVPMWPAIGNHEATRKHDDLTRPEASHYFSLFELPGNERWYRVDYALMTLLILDSNSRMSPEHEQYNWLRSQLRSERKRFTLVAFHHAPYTSGPHGAFHPDATPKEWPLDEGRRFLVPLFEMYGVDLVLNGHDHLYERSVKNGVPYVVTGGGGAPLYQVNSVPNPHQLVAKSTNHYVSLDISKHGIGMRAIDTTGAVIDAASFAPRAENLTRRAYFVGARVKANLTTGDPRLVEQILPCRVANPTDHPLQLRISLQEDSWTSDVETIELAPGAGKDFEVALAPPAAPGTKPWQTLRIGVLKVAVIGQDEALPIDFTFERRLDLLAPRYPLTTIANLEMDGDPKEWSDVPPIQIGASNPVPRGDQHYSGGDDMEADLRLALSGGMLHVFIDVRDEGFSDDGKSSYFESDSFNLILQPPAWKQKPGPAMTISVGASGRCNREIEHRVRRGAEGYSIEASIPLSSTPFAQRANGELEVRFEVVLVDRDPGQGPSLHRLWTNHLRANAADYGVLHATSR